MGPRGRLVELEHAVLRGRRGHAEFGNGLAEVDRGTRRERPLGVPVQHVHARAGAADRLGLQRAKGRASADSHAHAEDVVGPLLRVAHAQLVEEPAAVAVVAFGTPIPLDRHRSARRVGEGIGGEVEHVARPVPELQGRRAGHGLPRYASRHRVAAGRPRLGQSAVVNVFDPVHRTAGLFDRVADAGEVAPVGVAHARHQGPAPARLADCVREARVEALESDRALLGRGDVEPCLDRNLDAVARGRVAGEDQGRALAAARHSEARGSVFGRDRPHTVRRRHLPRNLSYDAEGLRAPAQADRIAIGAFAALLAVGRIAAEDVRLERVHRDQLPLAILAGHRLASVDHHQREVHQVLGQLPGVELFERVVADPHESAVAPVLAPGVHEEEGLPIIAVAHDRHRVEAVGLIRPACGVRGLVLGRVVHLIAPTVEDRVRAHAAEHHVPLRQGAADLPSIGYDKVARDAEDAGLGLGRVRGLGEEVLRQVGRSAQRGGSLRHQELQHLVHAAAGVDPAVHLVVDEGGREDGVRTRRGPALVDRLQVRARRIAEGPRGTVVHRLEPNRRQERSQVHRRGQLVRLGARREGVEFAHDAAILALGPLGSEERDEEETESEKAEQGSRHGWVSRGWTGRHHAGPARLLHRRIERRYALGIWREGLRTARSSRLRAQASVRVRDTGIPGDTEPEQSPP